jgi:phosphotransferase system enzyme I (PtsP)
VKALMLETDLRKLEALIEPLLAAPADSVSIRDQLKAFAETEGLPL